MNSSIRIIKRTTCPKITASANGQLTYEVGYDASDESFLLRITANPGGGFFSNEWVTLENISTILKKHPNTLFKAPVFKPLFESLGANNHGFIAAVLRSEGIILADDKYVRSNSTGNIEGFIKSMEKLVVSGVEYDDEIAAEKAEAEARRQAILDSVKQAAQISKPAPAKSPKKK